MRRFISLLYLFSFLFVFVSFSHAQTPTVPPATGNTTPDAFIPCNDTSSNEFHSLRPYQGSPCNPLKEDLALYCGNDLFVGQSVSISKVFGVTNPEIIERDPIGENYSYNGNTIEPSWSDINYSSNPCYYCADDGSCKRNPYACEMVYDCADLNCGECRDNGSTETCIFTVSGSNSVAVDVRDAEFPIMGYTEPSAGNDGEAYKVINSVNDEETMDNATKMNEYVSWYLNGVNGRAEYPYLNPELNCVGESTKKPGSCMETRLNFFDDGKRDCYSNWGIPFVPAFKQITLLADGKSVCTGLDNYCCVSRTGLIHTDDTPGSDIIVNYSGPIKKLLPFSIQNIERINENIFANESVNNDAGIRHDQIVACFTDSTNPIEVLLNGITNTLNFTAPIKCYHNEQKIFGIPLPGYLFNPASFRLTDFNDHLPPIEDTAEYLGKTYTDWLIKYKEWRGNTCKSLSMRLPIINYDFTMYLCLDNPFQINFYGNVFSYIPFSSTEDRLGDVKIKTASIGARSYSGNIKIIYSRLTNVKDAQLFVPHMEEGVELADILQDTFAYKDADKDTLSGSSFVPYSPYCDFKQVRSNPGDDLFAGEISADVSYTAQITCTYFNWGGTDFADYGNLCTNLLRGRCVADGSYCDTYHTNYDCGGSQVCCTGVVNEFPYAGFECMGPGTDTKCVPANYYCEASFEDTLENCPANYKCVESTKYCPRTDVSPPLTQSCTNQVLVDLKLETRTPLADKVWAKLVAGSSGIFRRMFPKIGESGAIEGILDIPASTNVTYSGTGTVYAGNLSGVRTGSAAKLYFPHIGGVKEYFLTGIQTLLRPKGMGKQIVSGTDAGEDVVLTGKCSGAAFGEIGTPPGISSRGVSRVIPLLENLTPEHFYAYEIAEAETGVPCEILAGVHWIEASSAIDRDLQSGAYLGGRTLAESAIQAAHEIQGKVGISGNFSSFDQLIEALSLYNGGGNANCQIEDNCAGSRPFCSWYTACDSGVASACRCPGTPDASSCRSTCGSGFHYSIPYTGSCPVSSFGYDDIYPVNFLTDNNMYLLYPRDCAQAAPSLPYDRPGSFTFALGLYLFETGELQ